MEHRHGWLIGALVVLVLAVGSVQPAAAAAQIDIAGPAGSGAFGTSVTVLPNGNIVITDPYYDDGATEDVGAVYLYDGSTGALISTLTGSTGGDQVGSDAYGNPRVTVLSNGNYVVGSPAWDNGEAADAGAVTWGDGTTGVSGVVSAANSLVGGSEDDRIGTIRALSNGNYVVYSPVWDNGPAQSAGAVTWGDGTGGTVGVVSAANSLVGSAAGDQLANNGLVVLSNGNYVVPSPHWDNGGTADVGAVTWGSGTGGVVGPVSEGNSLVGSTADDQVGIAGVTALSNGNYVVSSPLWDDGTVSNAGAATWGDGTTGTAGVVSAANSLVGSTANDYAGYRVAALSNGNYVASSPDWDNGGVGDAGAVTWGDGTVGISGPVSAANSLVGTSAGDLVGEYGATALTNGNYVVMSPHWDNGSAANAGAVTWGDGTTSSAGVVSAANSLVGSSPDDMVGWWYVVALSNGNYVVRSPYWDNGTVTDAGAVTWGDGTTGTVGVVSEANSLVGSSPDDRVGDFSDYVLSVTVLSNGNYVVSSPYWDNGPVVDAGAATWGDGTTGTVGVVSAANSLVGSTAGDQVGYVADYNPGVKALSNGNYVVRSPYWDKGPVVDAGAATWGNGSTGTIGAVSEANSLVGSTAGDRVGYVSFTNTGITALSNGNYVIVSRYWDNDGVADAGAVTWGNGTSGTSGAVSEANSLVGSTADDQVGYYSDYAPLYALSSGDYVVSSAHWDNDSIVDAGAVTWGNGTTGTTGQITMENSVLGTTADGGSSMWWWGCYDSVNHQLVVGRPADNIVTLFRLVELDHSVFLPVILKNAP